MADIANAETRATITNYLKEVWLNIWKPTQNLLHPLLSEVEEMQGVEFDGRTIHGVVETKTGGNVVSIGEGKKLPEARSGREAQWTSPISFTYARFSFTGPAMAVSRRDKGAYKRVVARQVDDRLKSIRLYKNRVLQGNGDGVLCTVGGAPVGLNVPVDNAFGVAGAGPGARFLRSDEFYAVLQPNGTLRGTFTSTDVDRSVVPNTVTMDAVPVGTAAGDLIVLATADDTAFGNEPPGLLFLIDDADGTILGIDNTDPNFNSWRSPVINAGGGISEMLIMRAHARVASESGMEVGRDGYFQMTSPGLYLNFGETLLGLKRFNDTYELKGGFSTVDVNGMPTFIDYDNPLGTWSIVCKEDFARVNLEDQGYIDLDGSMYLRITDTDAFEAVIKEYWSYISLRRNSSLRIEGITGDDPSLIRGGGAY